MAEIQQFRELATEKGLVGKEAVAFIQEQQGIARTERQLQRKEAQRQREADDRAKNHELELHRLNNERNPRNQDGRNIKAPKLPGFIEGKDQIDNFIRFERYARASEWPEENWAISLGALLTGKALEAYTRLSEEDATNYRELKKALMNRYNLTK